MGAIRFKGTCRRTVLVVRGARAARSTSRTVGVVVAVVFLCSVVLPAAASAEPLCTDTWTGPSEGSWGTAADWSAGHVPTSTDVVCIGAGKKVRNNEEIDQAGVVQGEGSLELETRASLEITNALEPSVLASLTVAFESKVTGAATLEVSKSLVFHGDGRMSGSGTTVLLAGATGSTVGGAMFLEERTLINEGSLTLGAESGNLEMRNGAVFENHGTVDDNANFISGGEGGTAPRFVNYGAFDRTEHTVQPGEVKVSFVNHGSVSVETGVLGFLNPTVEPSSSWSATFEKGDIVFTGGTLTFKESNLLEGDISIIGAIVTTEHTKTSHVALGVGEGTLNVASGTTLAVERLALEANFRSSPLFATITGAGTLTVKESFRWTEGKMTGSGSTVLQHGSSSVLVKGAELLERTLVNEGTATIEPEQGYMSITKGAKLVNGGTFDDNSLFGVGDESEGSGSSARIVNTGVFQKTVGSETTPVQVPFENLGAIKEPTGHIHVFYPIAATPPTSVYGGPGNPSAPDHPCPICKDPVVVATGDLVETQTDLSVGGRGVGLGLTRTYNSQAGAEGTKGIFGYGWSSTFSDHLNLEKETSKATLHQADGSTVAFSESGGSLIAPTWSPDKLIWLQRIWLYPHAGQPDPIQVLWQQWAP